MPKSSSALKRAKERRANTPEGFTKALDATEAAKSARLPNGLEMQPATLEQMHRFAEGGYLYAILDACDAPAVPDKARELGETAAVSLFKGSAQEDYSTVAPYLFKVSPETLDWIVATLWNQPWGVFVLSKADLESLRLHFRHFLLVQLPDGERWFFRYYDPRILKVYLPNCIEWELQKFICTKTAAMPTGDITVPSTSMVFRVRFTLQPAFCRRRVA